MRIHTEYYTMLFSIRASKKNAEKTQTFFDKNVKIEKIKLALKKMHAIIILGNVPKKDKSMDSIVDIAKKAHVSKSTVGRVLSGVRYGVSDKTREKVLAVVKEYNFVKSRTATAMRTKKSLTVLLVVPDITNPFWAEVARGAQNVFDQAGYSVFLGNSDWQREREIKYIQLAKENKVDAIMINAPELDPDEAFRGLDCPVVLLGDTGSDCAYKKVGTNAAKAVTTALEYLLAKRHTDIGFVSPLRTDNEGINRNKRYIVYKRFMKKHGLPLRNDRLFNLQLSFESGVKLARHFVQMTDRPSAIVAGNDSVAIGFINEALKLGVCVPGDVSIIGLDDIEMSAMVNPAITTVAKPKKKIGECGARMVLDMLDGRKKVKSRFLKPVLIERESVAVFSGRPYESR